MSSEAWRKEGAATWGSEVPLARTTVESAGVAGADDSVATGAAGGEVRPAMSSETRASIIWDVG